MKIGYIDSREYDPDSFDNSLRSDGTVFIDYPIGLSYDFFRRYPIPAFDHNSTRSIIFTTDKEFFDFVSGFDCIDNSGLLVTSGGLELYYIYCSLDSHNLYMQFNPKQRKKWAIELIGMWPKTL